MRTYRQSSSTAQPCHTGPTAPHLRFARAAPSSGILRGKPTAAVSSGARPLVLGRQAVEPHRELMPGCCVGALGAGNQKWSVEDAILRTSTSSYDTTNKRQLGK